MDTIRINLVYEMRLILFIILFQKILFAQDSLFWFDMSKVRDPVPKTPMVMDKIFGLSQFTMIDSLKKLKFRHLMATGYSFTNHLVPNKQIKK